MHVLLVCYIGTQQLNTGAADLNQLVLDKQPYCPNINFYFLRRIGRIDKGFLRLKMAESYFIHPILVKCTKCKS